jgi:hypothetical protein
MLRAAYVYCVHTPPFNEWNLPDSGKIRFRVVSDERCRGWYWRQQRKHEICISETCIGRSHSLIETMAHEMIHLRQAITGNETKTMHNAEFRKLAAEVCAYHGFDPKLF